MSFSTHYFITGTSRGIGKALAEHILEQDSNSKVEGIARHQDIKHPNYHHHTIDLSKTEEIIEWTKSLSTEASKIVLVNNAGALGEVAYVGEQQSSSIASTININITAPFILMNEFLKKFGNQELVILNISSGASQRAIDGWSVYCASKASLNMFSEVVKAEQENRKRKVHVFSSAVGVVDTQMQAQIRSSDKEQFSNLEHFHQLKENKELRSPKEVAQKLYDMLITPENYEGVWQRV